jgi:prevent-host-death family protein
MIAVGIREIKNRLSEYLRRAREGEVVLITDRGRVVAQLTSPGASVDDSGDPLSTLEARGLLTRRGAPGAPGVYPELARVAPEASAAQLTDELRAEG